MSTRRTAQRQLLLRPDDITNQITPFVVGVGAARYGMKLHALVVMSNTVAINYSDVHGNDPDFRQYVFSLLARCMNVRRSRWEALWSSAEPNVLALMDGAAELDFIVYNVTDPVRQELVDKAANWPGFTSLPYQLSGKPKRVKRPKNFFRDDGSLPDEVSLHFVPPPSCSELSTDEYAALLRGRVRPVEEKMAAKLRAEGRRVMGRKAILRQSSFAYPKTTPPRRNLNPRLACKDKEKRARAIEAMKHFEARYHATRERLLEAVERGEDTADILFPYGTWQLVRRGLVQGEDAPS